jgi:adenylate cyclase
VASSKKSALLGLRWLLLAPIPILWCVIAHYGWLQFLENKTIDWRFQKRGPIDAPVNIIYVNVDSDSLETIGGWPWSREYFAVVADNLIKRGGVKAIGMDVVFSDDGVSESVDRKKLIEGNRSFEKVLFSNENIFIAASYAATDFIDSKGNHRARHFPDLQADPNLDVAKVELPELPSFLFEEGKQPKYPGGGALIDTVKSETRQVRVYAPTSNFVYYAMAVELARTYYGVDRDDIKIADDHMDLVKPDGSLAVSIPLYRRQIVDINWFSKWLDAKRNPFVGFSVVYNYCDLANSSDPVARKSADEFFAQFKDSIVLIGPTDPLLHDRSTTPVDDLEVPRVSVHGNLLKTILTGKFIRRIPEWASYLIIIAMAFVVTTLAVSTAGRSMIVKTLSKAIAVVVAAAYVGLSFELFKVGQILIPVVAPIGAVISTSVVGLLWQVI